MPLSLVKVFDVTEKAKREGSMVCLDVPMGIQVKLEERFRDIEGDPVGIGDMHITIGLVRSEDFNKNCRAMKEVAEQLRPFTIKLEKMDIFPPHKENDNKIVLYLKPEFSLELARMHAVVFDVFQKFGCEIDNGEHDFSPHITVKYCVAMPKRLPKISHGKFRPQAIRYVNRGTSYVFPFRKPL